MREALGDGGNGTRWLLVAAAPPEARAVMRGRADAAGTADGSSCEKTHIPPWCAQACDARTAVLLSGVGKANAAGAVAAAFDPRRHAGVLNLGICGALPGSHLEIGDTILATSSRYADEGVITPEGFEDVASMGFPPGALLSENTSMAAPIADEVRDRLAPLCDVRGTIATVSGCSGSDEAARRVAERTGALAEAMEGAAVGFTCLALRRVHGLAALPFAELRIVSNTTGDRSRQVWALPDAFERLRALSAVL